MIRHGFVSNSSSSSFVLVVTLAEHEQVLKRLTDFERAVVSYTMKEALLYDFPVMFWHDLSLQDESRTFGWDCTFAYEDWPLDDNGDKVSVYDVMAKYEKMVHGFSSTIYD
jgi:hypothetical protein